VTRNRLFVKGGCQVLQVLVQPGGTGDLHELRGQLVGVHAIHRLLDHGALQQGEPGVELEQRISDGDDQARHILGGTMPRPSPAIANSAREPYDSFCSNSVRLMGL